MLTEKKDSIVVITFLLVTASAVPTYSDQHSDVMSSSLKWLGEIVTILRVWDPQPPTFLIQIEFHIFSSLLPIKYGLSVL